MTLPEPLGDTAARALRALLTRRTATRPELAAVLGCDAPTAEHRHETMLTFVGELVRPGLAARPDPDGRG